MNNITEEQLAEMIQEALWEQYDDIDFNIHTFEDAGVLTRDSGIVISTDEGDEFQITISKVN